MRSHSAFSPRVRAWLPATDVGVGDDGRPCNKPMTHKRNGCFSWRCTTQRSSAWKTDAWRSFSHSRRRSCRPREVCGGGTGVSAGLKVYQTVHGEFHADVAATLNHLGGPPAHVRPVCPGGALADAGSGHQRETRGPRPFRRGVACRESGPAARGPQEQPEKAEPLYRRSLAIPERALGPPIQRSRRCWRTLPKCCGNEGVQTRWSRRSCAPKTFARSGVEPVTPSSVAYPLWQCTTNRLPSTGA